MTREPHFQRSLENGSAEPPEADSESYPQRSADALVAIAETTLAHGPTPLAGADRCQLVVHVDASLAGGHLDDGSPLADETTRRLACDCAVVPIAEIRGSPLSVGRKTRKIPAHIRRAVRARDRGCRFPGCRNHRWVDNHHLRHSRDGGETSLENLVQLCRRHHRLVHEGDYRVERRPDGTLVFHHPRGWVVANSPPPPPGDAGRLPDGAGLWTGTGERMDRAACVDAVFAATGRT